MMSTVAGSWPQQPGDAPIEGDKAAADREGKEVPVGDVAVPEHQGRVPVGAHHGGHIVRPESMTAEGDETAQELGPPVVQVSDNPKASTTVTTDVDTLWRLCTRGIEPLDARQRAAVRGNAELAEAVLQIVSIIR